jgi:hypothetical protein
MLLADIIVTRDDFERCNWQEVIASCEDKECVAYSTRFFAKAREAEGSGDTKAQGVFVLLGAMTSFSLNLDPIEQPFHPKVVLQNYRSAVLADIRDTQLDVLQEVAPQIIDPEMRARIGDILWVRKRDFRMAQLAIEAYLASATCLEDPQSWPPCERRIKRAVQLAASLGRTGEYFSKTLAHVEAVLDKYNAEDPRFLSAKMMELLLTYRPRDAS